MGESRLAEELQQNPNIDKIRLAVEKVKRQKKVENSDGEELDFDNLNYDGDNFG